MIIYPILAAILSSGNTLFEKFVYDHKRKQYKIFVPITFLFSFLIISIFFYPFLGEIKKEAFALVPLIILGAVVVIASLRNILYYSGFQREGLSEIEPLVVFTPLLTIVIAGIFYPDERNTAVLVLALIAAVVLIGSHIEKRHLKFDKGLIPIMGAVFLEAIENNLIKTLLENYSPVAMYTVRIGLVSLLLFIFIRPDIKKVKSKDLWHLGLIGFVWVLIMIFVYYGYQTLGVVYTALILMLVPVSVVIGSYFVLKEKKIRKRDIVALVVILGCVIAAQFLR